MHLSSAIAFATLAFPIFVAADCNTGSVQCCQSLESTSTTGLGDVLAGAGLLGISINAILGSTTGLVGLDCAPLSLLSLSGTSCSTQPVCCTNNYLAGVIQAGCTPVNSNL